MSTFVGEHPHIPLVVVVDVDDVSAVAAWIRQGAVAVVAEGDEPTQYIRAVEAARTGRSVMTIQTARAMAQRVPESSDLSTWISTDERTWLAEMAAGKTVAELASDLGYSERAMFRNLRRLYVRLGVKNRTEALIWAERNGLFEGDFA